MRAKRIVIILFSLSIVAVGLLFVQTVLAQIEPGINAVGAEIALPSGDPRIIAAKIIRAALGFLGIIALGIVLYGGFVWMTSAGNEEKLAKAKKILTNGVIGLAIILLAFGITQYVLNTLMGIYGAPSYGTPTGPPVIGRYSGALGNGIVESHYPPRGGMGIARNTKIIVTFKEPMSLESIIDGYEDKDTPVDTSDDTVRVGGTDIKVVPPVTTPPTPPPVLPLKSENIKIYISDPDITPSGEATALASNQVRVTFTDDLKTFVFDPVEYLGSPSQNIWYTTALKSGLKKVDERGDVRDAFDAGAFRDGYAWDFETSTIIDTTPPQVESYWPNIRPSDTIERNTLIQINFDEAMDPTTVSGAWPMPFNMIETKRTADGTPIDGKWEISNQYKTVEFISSQPCEGVPVNSCGQSVYCLPANQSIDVLAKAATLGSTPPEALAPSDGVTDAAGNSLNGNKNDIGAEGSGLDDAERTIGGTTVPAAPCSDTRSPCKDDWGMRFTTNNEIRLTPPKVEAVNPPGVAPGSSNVLPAAPVEITFDGVMSMGSFSTGNIILDDNQRLVEKTSGEENACAVWFTNGGINIKEEPAGTFVPVESTDDVAVKTRAKIYHGDFIPSDTTPPQTCTDDAETSPGLVIYYPRATHRVKDIYQNCFYPPAAVSAPPVGGQSCTGTLPAASGHCKWGTE